MDRTQKEILSNFGGEIDNCLGTIFANTDEDDESSPLIQLSTFLDANSAEVEKFLRHHENNFTIFSMNADSLHAKHSELLIFVDALLAKGLHFSAICIQEARINKDTNCKTLDLPQYEMIPEPFVCSTKGGLAIYLYQNFFHLNRTKELYKKSRIFEAQFIDVYGPQIQNKITLVNIYRPPRCNNNPKALNDFVSEIQPSFIKLKNENNYTFVAEDTNINLLKIGNDSGVNGYFEFLCDNDFLPQITLPTRFAKKNLFLD